MRTQIQYRVVNKQTHEVIGYIVGKTLDRELVLSLGTKTILLKITPENEHKYSIEVLEVQAGRK